MNLSTSHILAKIGFTLLGIPEEISYWEKKRAYKKTCKLISWAYDEVQYSKVFNGNVLLNNTIWVYWKQGFDKSPNIVKKCIRSISAHRGKRELVLLTEENLYDYISFPDYIEEKHRQGVIDDTHYSDMLRCLLLIQYGGIWIDATCFMSAEIPNLINDASFFMFSTGQWWAGSRCVGKCSNWFIKSEADNYLLKKTLNFHLNYWRKKNKLIHYFIFHFSLSYLCDVDPECRKIWDSVPYMPNSSPTLLQYSFGKHYVKVLYDNIIKQSFIHKCTYKFNPSLMLSTKENVLQHFFKDTRLE